MAKRSIEGTAIIRSVKYKGGGELVFGNFNCKHGSEALKRLANAKPDKKELVDVTIEPVQKTLTDEES